ncbi:hypothetical protein [Nostoc sp.]|uniref:hypothetical protein n=1 Tax=Nostoc sp. TaxID=1180 RepID=UPI002FF05230
MIPTSHTPLFQVMFVLQNAPMSEIDLTGLTVSSLPIESSTAKFDLTLSIFITLIKFNFYAVSA